RQEPVAGWTQYTAAATGGFTIKSPATAGALSYRAGGGKWQTAAKGKQSFTAEETAGQAVQLVVGKPAWLELNDADAPAVTLTLDGKDVAVEEAPKLGWIDAPKVLVATFRDAANPLAVEGLRVTLNGKRLDGGPDTGGAAAGIRPLRTAAADGGKTLRVEVDLARALAEGKQARKHVLEIALADKSVDRRVARVQVGFMVRQPQDANAIYLSDLKPVSSFAHGGLIRDTDYVGNPAQIGDVAYPKCLTLCPEPSPEGEHGEVVYELPADKGALVLKADIGLSTSSLGNGSVEFLVQVGDTPKGTWKTLYKSPVMRGGQDPVVVETPMGGAKYLRLYTTSASDGINSDHALWGAVRLVEGK
ncbi:MAG: NPCBM/NEW2 domain-containing protein, partial [Armatimonadetes bacterium]|nr:NPCBM/NEW2 domain-containing protein [Armatimonadota bacterium]